MTATLSLTLPPTTDSVTALLEALEAFTDEHELPIKAASRLMLLAEELAANVVMHGTGATFFQADLALEGEVLRFSLTDDGPAFDPLGAAKADTEAALEDREVGGLGVHLVRQLASSAAYSRQGDKNHLALTLDAAAE